jgi:DNA-binding CsgD family transcriptional regulator
MVEGLYPMPPFMRRWLLEHHLEVAQRGGSFTRKEEAVLRHLVAGVPNKAIAAQLGVSEASAKECVKRILWKMGASNRAATTTVPPALAAGWPTTASPVFPVVFGPITVVLSPLSLGVLRLDGHL